MTGASAVATLAGLAALATALLSWLAIDAGIAAMTRYRAHFTERTRFQVSEFFLFIDPARLYLLHLALVGVGAAAAALLAGSLAVGAGAAGGLAFLPRLLYGAMRTRRRRRFEEQLPDALLMLAGALRAGLSLSVALAQLVEEAQDPLRQEFALLLREQRMGMTLDQGLNGLVRRMPTPTTVLTVSTMRIAADTGGGLAEMLERTATTLRSRLQMEGKIRALTSQGKLQAWVVGALPLLLMFVLNKMEPGPMQQLWHTPLGWGALGVIGFLEFMGIWVIRKIVRIDV